MAAHVFFDNSNIWLGATSCREEREPHVPQSLFRIYFRNIFELVEDGRVIETKELAGSLPPQCEPLWTIARSYGYNTNLLRRVDEDGRAREQGVDEALHLKMANVLLDFDPPQTLVLVTGDGAQSELNTSFFDQIRRALRRGWSAEVWSWAASRSRRYNGLKSEFGESLTIHDLDRYYNSITFVNSGQSFFKGVRCDVAQRVVSPL